MSKAPSVIIVGAGAAGLACAGELRRHGIPCRLLDRADRPGGRLRTDMVDGFRLDHGFQVYPDAYPAGRECLDISALQLHPFSPGALVFAGGRIQKVGDPRRQPSALWGTLRAEVGTWRDKLRILSLQRAVVTPSLEELWRRPEVSTLERLREHGFSERMLESFFRPFLGGIFLENDLDTSSRHFEFVFRMFATGRATLPAAGIEAIAAQLQDRAGRDCFEGGRTVVRVRAAGVELDDGTCLSARAVVLAVDGAACARLSPGVPDPSFSPVLCLYFSAPRSPIQGPWLWLNGEGVGPVNNLAVPTEVAPSYGPPGRALLSATLLSANALLGESEAVEKTLAQMHHCFGSQVDEWEFLRSYRIERALPRWPAGTMRPPFRPPRLPGGIYGCGDHFENPSLNGALASGLRAARAIVEDLAGSGPHLRDGSPGGG